MDSQKQETDGDLKEAVKTVISRIARIDREIITDSMSLRKDLWIDSLQAVQIISLLEQKYEIEIDEVEIFNVDSTVEIVELIKEYRSGGQAEIEIQ